MQSRQYNRAAQLFIMTLILLLAALFRIINIDALDLWVDEGFTQFVTQYDNLLEALIKDVHPPLYFTPLTLWTKIAGDSELSLRYFSLLPGMLNISMVALLARELLRFRPKPAKSAIPLVAAFLMAIADMDIYISQEARNYAWLVFIGMACMWAMLRWIRTGKRSYAMLWVLCSAAMVYTHYLGAWTPIAQGVFVLLFLRGKQRVQAIGLLVASAALLLPWAIFVILPYQVGTFGINVSSDPSTLQTLWNYRISFLSGQWALMGALALMGLVSVRYQHNKTSIKIRPMHVSGLLLLWIIVPVALTYILNIRAQLLLFDYRIAQISPAFSLLIAFGIGNVRRESWRWLLPVLLIYSVAEVNVYRPKPPWSEYAREMTEYVQDDDAIVIDFGGGDYQLLYYLENQLPDAFPIASMRQWSYWQPATYEAGMLGFMSDYETIWLMRWNERDESFVKLDFAGLTETAQWQINHPGGDLRVYRFDRIPENPVTTYENGMILHSAAIYDDLQMHLLWSAQNRLDESYVISGVVLNENGQLIAQLDSPPVAGMHPTNTWQPDEFIYDMRLLVTTTGQNLPPGSYQAGVIVYRIDETGDIVRLETIDGDDTLIFADFVVD
ncbi:MAG: glycosyltransferase family 39 protein [Aggregatilineales bacterium]